MTKSELIPAVRSPKDIPDKINAARRALDRADDPDIVHRIEASLSGWETLMRDAGMYQIDEVRPVNELRMRARWKLGLLLAQVERQTVAGPGRGKKGGKTKVSDSPSFSAFILSIGLNKDDARVAQRIGTLPENEFVKTLVGCVKEATLCTFARLVDVARPYWYQESRAKKHRDIARDAKQGTALRKGNFALIYADPPWKFSVYSDKGLERTPDQHYPTMTDEQLIDFGDKLVANMIAKRAAIFMWCTSSNLKRALHVFEAWGFDYKASAVWVKDKSGLGLVFRNQHEVLLYGTRGTMPGPRHQPKSVFSYPRGKHSAKPPEVRKIIEKMYPDFDEDSRLEIFARGAIKGWSAYGNEAKN